MKDGIVRLRERPEFLRQAAAWFHEKWGVPEEAYRESMEACLAGKSAVPQWYLALDGETIAGGMGVIENDFHPRTDLTPNVCAVFTEPEYRGKGLAGALLRHVCADMKAHGVDTLYLLTDHDGFYERYGWELYDMVCADGERTPSRVYIHRA